MLKTLLDLLPANHQNMHYAEPFLGSGALFFALRPTKALISDANEQLIACYRTLRDKPSQLFRELQRHVKKHSQKYYFTIRSEFNRATTTNNLEQAGRFLYLNRACWNGVFRVNLKDQFNVPYGHKNPLPIPTLERMRQASNCLKHAKLLHGDFDKVLDGSVGKNSLLFVDPPYPPKSRTAYFSHYTTGRFDWDDHKRLAHRLAECAAEGAKIILTLPDISDVRALYRSFIRHHAYVFRLVSCKVRRKRVRELILTNYRAIK